ncbi:MAG: hypothetical protein IAE82_11545 [Opitutaceae bacterium]|nr:hypothetical protein [Opitutaceae bacterium]
MNRGLLKSFALSGLIAALSGGLYAADVNVGRIINTNTTWTSDNVYYLSGYTFVVTPNGAASPTVLTIQPGTVIKGRQKVGGGEAAALVVTRGAQINAAGSPSSPIIFTSELDNLAGNLGPDDTNLWGGLVVLGRAQINSRANDAIVAAPVVDQIEGFSVAAGETDYITFGGNDDADNSGTIRYVSIRHGGDVLGTANEINGLTLGGVGNGTTIEYVEVFANKDDGIEFFGGTVDVRYLATVFGKDDGFDYDSGWRGRGQFWFTLGGASTTESADKGGEWDGATAPLNATPLSNTAIYNATFIGNGAGGLNNTALNIRDNASARVYNSVFVDYNKMIDIENDAQVNDTGTAVPATTERIELRNNIWWSHVAGNNTAAGFNARPAGTNAAFSEAFFSDAAFNNTIANPALAGISRTANAGLDPRPTAASPALSGAVSTVPNDGWYVQTTYKGAFAPFASTWLQGWTKLSNEGYLKQIVTGVDQEFVNLSTRCFVGTGDQVAIPGFVIDGTAPKRVLIRAVGEKLGLPPPAGFGVAGTIADPVLTLKRSGTTVATNDDWDDAQNATEVAAAAAAVYAFSLPAGGKDAALLVTLDPGVYTAIAEGKNGATGVALIEVYAIP